MVAKFLCGFVALLGFALHLSIAYYQCERIGEFECRITPNDSITGTIVNTLQCLYARNLEPEAPNQYTCNFQQVDTGCQVQCDTPECLTVTNSTDNSTSLIRVRNYCGEVYLRYKLNTSMITAVNDTAGGPCSNLTYNVLVPQ